MRHVPAPEQGCGSDNDKKQRHWISPRSSIKNVKDRLFVIGDPAYMVKDDRGRE